jgi:hypothetical protein
MTREGGMSRETPSAWNAYPRAMRRNALNIWGHEDAVQRVVP